MNKILEENFTTGKPDATFEQRMLAGFRNRIPERGGLVRVLVDLMRIRAVQITAVAAILLALVQMGRMITGESATPPRNREAYANQQVVQPGRAGSLDKSDKLDAGEPKDFFALQKSQPTPATRSELRKRRERM